jgi:hypothetical protein
MVIYSILNSVIAKILTNPVVAVDMMSANSFGGAYIFAEGCVIYKIEGVQGQFLNTFRTRFEKVLLKRKFYLRDYAVDYVQMWSRDKVL